MDMLTMHDAALQGVARYNRWRKQFKAEFQKSVELNKLSMAFVLLPPPMREALQKADPERYAAIVDYINQRSNTP